MRIVILCCIAAWSCPALADEPVRIAVFNFSLIDTSPAPPTADELARLTLISVQLRTALAGRYTVIDAAGPQAKLDVVSIKGCNGCELDIAGKLGAQQVAYGWVQKVSNLILNVNLIIEDAATGKRLRGDSVDIRSNTDESWTRGLRYLLDERLYRDDPLH